LSDLASNAPVLRLVAVSKFFGGVRALSDVDLELRAGEVLALVGDNGAGKSTLFKIISGLERPNAGTISFEGVPVVLASPNDASALCIQTVYQDLALCDNLDVVQNLFLGREVASSPLRGGRIARQVMERRAVEVLGHLNVNVPSLRTPVGRLSGGQRQSIAVCRSELAQPKVVLLDEPTAALGVAQRTEVINLIRRLRDQGRAVALVSHDLHDVRQVADRIVVLRLGRKVAEFDRSAPGDRIVAAITGMAHAHAEEYA
jgi:D-xylose transport system ATP-binding protein